MDELTVTFSNDRVLEIRLGDRGFEVHAMWLRDACVCSRCRDASSNERFLDATSIDPDITVRSTSVGDDDIRIETSDGHTVCIDRTRFVRHLLDRDRSDRPAGDVRLWTASGTRNLSWFAASDIDPDVGNDPYRRWLDAFVRDGIVATNGVQSDESGVREVASWIGPIRSTHYGEVWTVDATIAPETAVDSERALRAHTDLPYLDAAPGVQLLAVESDGVGGGASTFVDGFAAAEHLRSADPAAWRLLTATEFEYPFVRSDIEMVGRSPLIQLHRNGSYAEVRRAPDLVGVPFVEAADTPALYEAVAAWNDLLDGGEFEIEVATNRGDVVAWNNHRLLHGRTAFELGTHGHRVLYGCYVDADHLRSRHAIAHRSTED